MIHIGLSYLQSYLLTSIIMLAIVHVVSIPLMLPKELISLSSYILKPLISNSVIYNPAKQLLQQ